MTPAHEKEIAENIAKSKAPQAQEAEAEKQHVERTGWRKIFPQVVLDNATRISNAGLFTFTGIMLHSGYRGKQISQKIYDEQIDILKKAGYEGERLIGKTAELVEKKVITRPGWHKMRLIYLLTACTSFAFGVIFKRKEEKQEDLARYEQMSFPEYIRERTQEALNPAEHSRQTVGVLSGISGFMAVKSALSQPGGVHKSELIVGSLLALGGTLLAYVKDAVSAQKLFTLCWMARTPVIVTGTMESWGTFPGYKNPLIAQMKQTPEYFKGAEEALRNGYPEKVWLGLKTVHRTGGEAVKVYDKAFAGMALAEKRKDIAYPIGQWGNWVSAIIGISGKKPETKKQAQKTEAPAIMPTIATDDSIKPISSTTMHHEVAPVKSALTHETPSTKVDHVEKPHHAHGRVEARESAQRVSA